jgi:hypothetical protein
MTLDALIERLTELRKQYPQLASETVSMVITYYGDGGRAVEFQSIVGDVNMYTRDKRPHSIVIEDYVPGWRKGR